MHTKKILIIDDDKESLEELAEMLSLNGYEVISTSEVQSALEQTCLLKPNLILLDIKIKGKNGIHLADQLRQTAEINHIPIITINNFYHRDHNLIINGCTTVKFIKKPIIPNNVIIEIEKSLNNNQIPLAES